jgi:DNA-binding protein
MATTEIKIEAAGKGKHSRTTRRTRNKGALPTPQTTEATEKVRGNSTQGISSNSVFVGTKPVMNYVLACVTFLTQPDSQKVVVKARGRAIPRAVDTTELLRRVFIKDLRLEHIDIHTEEVARDQGRKSNVSAIEITLVKP